MAKAIVIREYGGPDVLVQEDIEVGEPGASEIRIKQTAVGVNFHDIYVRSGLYNTLTPPGIPGCEAAGVVESVGVDVAGIKSGDRVAYVTAQYGAYASERLLPANIALKYPDEISDRKMATSLLRALTVEMLINQVHPVQAGELILVHAAAGGVGRLMCQWASRLGAIVIGTVGSLEKENIAREAGCQHTILYRETEFSDVVMEITGGKGVSAAFDSVGCDTLDGSMAVLANCGHLINFGQSSGPVGPISMSTLAEKSLSITRPILFHYIADPLRLKRMAKSVFAAFADDVISADEALEIPLEDAAEAHAVLEDRSTAKPVVLMTD